MKGIDLPENRSIYTIIQLEKAIQKKKRFSDAFTEEERQVVEDRLGDLKTTIGWKDKYHRDMDMLKSLGAHSHVDREELKWVFLNLHKLATKVNALTL